MTALKLSACSKMITSSRAVEQAPHLGFDEQLCRSGDAVLSDAALRLVIFDCDGVLIDSEPVSRCVVAEEAMSLGWAVSDAELQGFTGLTWSALKPVFEAAIGRELPAEWPKMLQDRLIDRMRGGVELIEGAKQVLCETAALGLPYRIASNSSHQEMAQKFTFTGLLPLVEGRIHSARDVRHGKPAPDLFLAAAKAEGVDPAQCLVVEDSAPGIAAAHAAGMRVVAYARDSRAAGHEVAPHYVVRSLAELPALFKAAMMERAA